MWCTDQRIESSFEPLLHQCDTNPVRLGSIQSRALSAAINLLQPACWLWGLGDVAGQVTPSYLAQHGLLVRPHADNGAGV